MIDDTDRIVMVASGFGLWRGGRHVGSARWADVARISALTDAASAEPGVRVQVTLDTGMVLDLPESLPGWAAFLGIAAERLPGMPRLAAWRPTMAAPADAPRLLFERKGRAH